MKYLPKRIGIPVLHLFWTSEKSQLIWDSLFSWLQLGRIIKKDPKLLEANAAFSLRPDDSKYKLQSNFCFLTAKYYTTKFGEYFE